MTVWDATLDLCEYADTLSEVVGSPESVVYGGRVVCQVETTPPPVCLSKGYTAEEWAWHWSKVVDDTIQPPTVEDKRQFCMMLIREYQAKKSRHRVATR